VTQPTALPSNLGRRWIALGRALGFRTIAPADVEFAPGRWIRADVHLPDFGGPRGMLLFESGEIFRGLGNEIYEAGYGLSVLRDPRSFRIVEDDASVTIAVLQDWGWAGDATKRPRWLGTPEAASEPANSGSGITEADMQAYVDLNQGLPDPFPADLVRGKERHWLRTSEFTLGPVQDWHGHVGPVDDIRIKEDS
jgi:hypothetical protein